MLGRLREAAGWRERSLDAAPSSLSALRVLLGEEDPVLADALAAPSVQAAVNKTLVRGDVALASGDEVAFMPPMSGG